MGFLGGSACKEPVAVQEMWVQSLGSGRPSGGRHGNPLQDSCLENPMDREAWRVTVPEVTKESDMSEQISTAHHIGKEEMLQHIHDA